MTSVLTHRPEPAAVGVPAWKGDTIVSALRATARRHADRVAMRSRDESGQWGTFAWRDYWDAVREVAAGLAELGVEPGDTVAILGSNRPKWHMADLATMSLGAVTIPLYPTSSPAQIAYVLRHAGVSACFVDSHSQYGKVLEVAEQAPGLRRVILIGGNRRTGDGAVILFDELRALGCDRLETEPDLVDRRVDEMDPEALATVVYTSGTTGPPKGAMISHRNIMWTIRSVAPVYGVGEGDRLLSFLPLSHIAERMMSDFTPIAVTGETWFARSLASVVEDLPACRPTVFLAVPRVWEKLREGIETGLAGQPRGIRMAVGIYLRVGRAVVEQTQKGEVPAAPIALLRATLDRAFGAAIRHRIGLDQARVLVSAAAPIHPDLITWFHAAGLPIMQIYGQTEDCGPTSANPPDDVRIGTVGQPLPGVQLRLAADGEILVKGGNVCRGYLHDPGATAELIDVDGWMHSGDTGTFDPDGHLRVTGRKKDLIITASGKNVAPQDIEMELANHPLVSEAVVVGEGRNYLGALLTLDTEAVTAWANDHGKLADIEMLSTDPDLLAEVQGLVDQVNHRRSRAESIRKFRVLPDELTAAAGELTPTMKVRRASVTQHYAGVIDELYAGA